MMIPSNFQFLQLCLVVIFMVTRTGTTKVHQAIEEASQSYNDEQRPTPVHTDHHQVVEASKQVVLNEDDDDDLSMSNSDEEYNNYRRHHHNQPIWPQVVNKNYPKKMIRARGDGRLWDIPYRFGKRAAMPYRFGKRAAMHFRLGKKSASL